MTTMSSRDAEPKARPNRNFLYLVETEVVNRYRDMVVRELTEFMGDEDKRVLKLTPKEDLVMYHRSLGLAIRNEYELWMPEHEVTAIYHRCEESHPLSSQEPSLPKEIRVGDRMVAISGTSVYVDDHPCHPDNFSMSCLHQLWETLQ